MTVPAADDFLEALREALGPESIFDDEGSLREYSTDASPCDPRSANV